MWQQYYGTWGGVIGSFAGGGAAPLVGERFMGGASPAGSVPGAVEAPVAARATASPEIPRAD